MNKDQGWVKDIQCRCNGFLRHTEENGKHELECNLCHKKSEDVGASEVISRYKIQHGYVSIFSRKK